uniref:ATP synthase F0 subunit 8 n=1 Tax=Aconurella sibirica TaxID=2855835 RepID=UPI002436021F|nr:ATP synthase F0 subunit 8 [Aconurella sibirica]WEU77759.1 ATP synthase F0 subunit 8 [Aconurella sibirica]
MPQMAPTWWTFIMILSIIMMIVTMIMIYFSFIYMNKQMESKSSKCLNWKWL